MLCFSGLLKVSLVLSLEHRLPAIFLQTREVEILWISDDHRNPLSSYNSAITTENRSRMSRNFYIQSRLCFRNDRNEASDSRELFVLFQSWTLHSLARLDGRINDRRRLCLPADRCRSTLSWLRHWTRIDCGGGRWTWNWPRWEDCEVDFDELLE